MSYFKAKMHQIQLRGEGKEKARGERRGEGWKGRGRHGLRDGRLDAPDDD